MYTPAVTIVAAWIRALTGVGPSIASGSQTCSGNWALLPHAPSNSSRQIAVAMPPPTYSAGLRQPRLPEHAGDRRRRRESSACRKSSRSERCPAAKPKSPMRLTRNAFLPAAAAAGFSYQKPISR